ncbi:hypothetical protein C6Q18_12565 [Pseudomonas chlororaphis subsp. piscium]|nr:hypothetical protein C6Q18_12565 [Pseudomonas chlororaphis subsp. piscium]
MDVAIHSWALKSCGFEVGRAHTDAHVEVRCKSPGCNLRSDNRYQAHGCEYRSRGDTSKGLQWLRDW